MPFMSELASWNPFQWGHNVDATPSVGQPAPATSKLKLPRADDKPVVIAFLRHCGCPFAEKTFKTLREASSQNPQVHFVAISHSERSATDKWLEAVGGADTIEVIVDHERQLYGAYGLGLSSFWHVLNPSSLGEVGNLDKTESIKIRDTESGSRWQTAGMFAADAQAIIRYAHPAQSAEDMGNVEEALAAIK